jgi:hypothetical protein
MRLGATRLPVSSFGLTDHTFSPSLGQGFSPKLIRPFSPEEVR